MACEICKRDTCAYSFHSIEAQQEFDGQVTPLVNSAANEAGRFGQEDVVTAKFARALELENQRLTAALADAMRELGKETGQ
jgi:hypothetical protein